MTDEQKKKPRGRKQGHRTNGRGTLRLDVRTLVGRIARASGTLHLPTLNKMTAMIRKFSTQEPLRLDILRALRDLKLKPLAVYDAFVNLKPGETLTADAMLSLGAPLSATLEAWLPTADCGDKQREAHRTAINYVKSTGRSSATVSDVPAILRQIKARLAKDGHAAQFNRVRSSLQRYLRDTLGPRHELYEMLADVEPLKETKQRKNNPQSVAQILELARSIEAEHVPALWGMSLTGMGPKEFFDGWKIIGAGVHVPGTKRRARDRMVPLVLGARYTGAKGPTGRGAEWQARLFADAIRKASGGKVQPYDLRRTYATWMEAAQISRARRRQYMGHSLGDVTELYEKHEVDQYLIEDAARLEAWVRDRERETLTIEVASS